MDGITDEEVRHKPAVLATQLALQEQQPNLAGAISTVQEGLTWWQNSMTADKTEKSTAQSWLQQQMVHLQLKAGDRQSASQAFQKLQSLDRTSAASAKMLGQLARASAQGNPQQALALQSNLPPLPKLTGINLDDLEAKVAGQLSTLVARGTGQWGAQNSHAIKRNMNKNACVTYRQTCMQDWAGMTKWNAVDCAVSKCNPDLQETRSLQLKPHCL